MSNVFQWLGKVSLYFLVIIFKVVLCTITIFIGSVLIIVAVLRYGGVLVLKGFNLLIGFVKESVEVLKFKPKVKYQYLGGYAFGGIHYIGDSAGVDLLAYTPKDGVVIPSGGRERISTNIMFEIPKGYEGQIRPRSGLAIKYGVTVLNSPGTVDSDYRGVVSVVLINHGEVEYKVRSGERIAQIVFCKVENVRLVKAKRLSRTERGSKGFGSTGR